MRNHAAPATFDLNPVGLARGPVWTTRLKPVRSAQGTRDDGVEFEKEDNWIVPDVGEKKV